MEVRASYLNAIRFDEVRLNACMIEDFRKIIGANPQKTCKCSSKQCTHRKRAVDPGHMTYSDLIHTTDRQSFFYIVAVV